MPAKVVEVEGIGTVKFYKRSGSKGIRLTLGVDNTIRVTMPRWLSYHAAQMFVVSKKDWVASHNKPLHIFKNGDQIGKAHRVCYVSSTNQAACVARVTNNQIRVLYNPNIDPHKALVQAATYKGALRALKKEASSLLPARLQQLATLHGFSYQSVAVKHMRSRWGSCSKQQNLSLNIFLMQLPWDLIDYVIIHELAHTKALNHGKDFWDIMEACLPDARQRRKAIHQYRPAF